MPKVVSRKPSIFSKRLTELRKSRQLTQEQLAEKIGLSLSTIAYFESAAKNPKLETIYKISDFFGVCPEQHIVDNQDGHSKPGPSSKLDELVGRIKRLLPQKQPIINILNRRSTQFSMTAMSIQFEQVEKQALQLSREDREVLADRLLSTLDSEPLNDIDEAWIQEAERRYQEYKDGKVQGIPGDRVFGEIRQELGWQS